jgi:hypothetical protein
VLGKEPKPRKKFSVSPVPSATVGKAVADGLVAFAESFRHSAKPEFPVVVGSGSTKERTFKIDIRKIFQPILP